MRAYVSLYIIGYRDSLRRIKVSVKVVRIISVFSKLPSFWFTTDLHFTRATCGYAARVSTKSLHYMRILLFFFLTPFTLTLQDIV